MAFEARVCAQEIKLRPYGGGNGFRYQFTAKYTLLFPQDYSDFLVLDGPTIGVVITAECPPELDFQGPTNPVGSVIK